MEKKIPACVWRPPQMSYTRMCDYASFEYKLIVGYLLAPQMSYTPMCDYASFEYKLFVGYLLAEA